jgi:hypothetical protein
MVEMEKIEIAGTQKTLKSREPERSEATLAVGGTEVPLEMAELVRVFNAEKKALGLEAVVAERAQKQSASRSGAGRGGVDGMEF